MTAVVDSRIPVAAERALTERGFTICKLPPHPSLPPPAASHPDMLVFFAQDAILCTRSYHAIAQKELETVSRAAQRPIGILSGEVSDAYPHDILLNAAPMGDRLLCLPTHTANEITARYRVIPVKQGYAKCSTLPVGEGALITADPSIARAAHANRIDVLSVRAGYVSLTGYDTGFLGGAASFAPYFPTREILFCGALTSHPDGEAIRAFCNERGFETVSLSKEELTDIGTIFLI